MTKLFYVLGILSLILAGFALTAIRSDIQIGIAVTAGIGGFVLIGIGAILERLKRPEA